MDITRVTVNNIAILVPANAEPIHGIYTKDVVLDPATDVWARIFIPIQEEKSSKKQPVILFYHGGGFITFATNSLQNDVFSRKVSKLCDVVVILTNYRLSLTVRCPETYDDCYKTIEWLRSPKCKDHLPASADILLTVLLGDSTGGNIVHFLACRAAESDISPVQLRGVIELQPFFGRETVTKAEKTSVSPLLNLQVTTEMWKNFLPLGETRDHPNCNVFGPNSPDISALKLPPILVVTGAQDVLSDWHDIYIKKLREMGKDLTTLHYDKVDHGFCGLEETDSGNQKHEALRAVRDFILSKTE